MTHNVGGSDAAIRLVAGIMLVGVGTALADRPAVAAVSAARALVMFVNAYLRFCPPYALLHIHTTPKTPPARGARPVAPGRGPGDPGLGGGHGGPPAGRPGRALAVRLAAEQRDGVPARCAHPGRSGPKITKTMVNRGANASAARPAARVPG